SSDAVTEHRLTLTGLSSDTTYHYRVTSVGNTTATSVDGTFTTATEPVRPPAPTTTIPANQATLINVQPVIFGYAKSGNTILVYIDGDYKGKTETSQHASGTGNFTYSPSSALGLGWHTLVVKAENDDGMRSKPSKTVRFKIEAPYVAPTIIDSEVHDGTSPTIVITGLAKNDSVIQVLIDGVVAEEHAVSNHPSGTANFHYTITTDSDLSIGQHTLTLIARDRSGKPSVATGQIYFTKTEIKILPLPGLNPVLTSPVTYIVQTGDSLWKIAKRFIGFGVSYNDIVWANRQNLPSLLKNPSLLLPGWSLLIPVIIK
ncbi:MAG: LysM peptidoglycan-binding domain-containing protein, partial [Patescibacteria group bacterium]